MHFTYYCSYSVAVAVGVNAETPTGGRVFKAKLGSRTAIIVSVQLSGAVQQTGLQVAFL